MIPLDRIISARVYIGRPDGVTWEDISGFVSRIDITEGNADQPVSQLEMTIHNDEPEDYFSPRNRESKWNQFKGTYAPLLWPNREVYIETLITEEKYIASADGTQTVFPLGNIEPGLPVTVYFGEPYKWSDLDIRWKDAKFTWVTPKSRVEATGYTVDYNNGRIVFDTPPPAATIIEAKSTYVYKKFHGLLGDNIQASDSSVTVSCRDMAKRLQDCYIETVREYGAEDGVPAETVIQQIMDDNLGATAPSLYCPVSPGFMVTPYKVEYQSVWDAIQQVASQIGWFLGYRLVNGEYVLTLMEPPRTKNQYSGDNFLLSWEDDIYRQDLDIFDSDVRNAVKVTYYNKDTRKAESITVVDGASIAEYGRRAMEIERNNTSLIDTEEEAQTLAEAVLADLKDLTATTRLDMPFLPNLDVFDGIVITNPLVSSTADFFGVESVRHTLDFDRGRFRTEVTASGRVVGAHTKWLGMQTRPGAAKPVSGDEISGGIVDVMKTEIIRDGLVKVIFGPQGIIALNNNGDYSQLDGNGLAFYKAGSEEPSWYVHRMAMGQASDGDYIALDWDNRPKVLLGVRSLQTSFPNSGKPSTIEVYASNITEKGFTVNCQAWNKSGGVTNYTNSYALSDSNLPKEQIYSPNTPDFTARFRIYGNNRHSVYVNPRVYESSTITYKISYKKINDSGWILLGQFQTHRSVFNSDWLSARRITYNLGWEHWVTAPPGTYQIKVEFVSSTSSNNTHSGVVTISGIDCYFEDELLATGDVSYIAIEGGADE